jgi:hypothetical protein
VRNCLFLVVAKPVLDQSLSGEGVPGPFRKATHTHTSKFGKHIYWHIQPFHLICPTIAFHGHSNQGNSSIQSFQSQNIRMPVFKTLSAVLVTAVVAVASGAVLPSASDGKLQPTASQYGAPVVQRKVLYHRS